MAVTNDLVTDQRVDRSCNALLEAGYDITLVGRKLPESPQLDKRLYRTCRMRLLFRRSALFYAEYNLRLFLKLMTTKSDAFYANDTDTLLACAWAARLKRKRLVFDAHELFPEVPELVQKPRVRCVWQWVERTCLPRVDAAFTVCQSVAEEYHARYGIRMTVVRNVPEVYALDTEQYEQHEKPYIILYQGAVNVGRGVRELIDAMRWLDECRLVVAGNGDLLDKLQVYARQVEWSSRVEFLGRVSPKELHKLTVKADVGVCLLEDMGLNYRYALPNRIADFAHARVPIVATDFVEIRRVVDQYHIGACVEPCPKEKGGSVYEAYVNHLAEALADTIAYWRHLPREERKARFDRAGEDLCWEKEKKVLVGAVNAIFCKE